MRTWLPSELVESLGWTLLHFVWQGLAIALLLAVSLRLLRYKLVHGLTFFFRPR
jgi:hypothetical protein